MDIRQLKDGRWTVYYRIREGAGKGKLKWEYFGRGTADRAAAQKRNHELNLASRRPPQSYSGPFFSELVETYLEQKDFSYDSALMFYYRMGNILPEIGSKPATRLTYQDMDAYVSMRRKKVKDTTIRREITDIKALSEIVGSRPETLMRTYQHVSTSLRRQTVAKIKPIPIDQES